MTRKVVVSRRSLLLDDFFKVEEAQLSYERFDGTMSAPVRRLDLKRGDAVAAVVFNRAKGRVILVNQFRYATLARGEGWMIEIVAGLIDADEAPEEAVRREILEETGYAVEEPERISCFYPTPGITSERIILFYAETGGADPVAEGGGVADEHEDIQVLELSPEDAFAQVESGAIADGKTIIALMWLKQRRAPGSSA